MSTAVLDKLCAERDEVTAAAVAIAESEDFSPDDKTYTELRSRATDLNSRIASLADLLDQQAQADALDGKLAKAAQSRQQRAQQPAGLQTRESLGSMFITSPEFTEYRGRGSSGIFEADTDALQTRALPTSIQDLLDAGLHPAPYTVNVQPPRPPTPLMDNITQIQVSGNAVEFLQWEVAAGGAAKVPEGEAKPSMEFRPVVTSDTLDTYAVWTQLTRQMIEDFAAVRSYIDGELQRDVAREVEADAVSVLAGATLDSVTGDTLLGAIRVGMATVQSKGYTPGQVILNPADWAALDVGLLGDTLNGPRVNASFWGLTPIPSTEQPEGTAVVGDLPTAMSHFYRNAISLYVTDSHADTFVKNVFTLLAEKRGLTVVTRPQALVEASAA